jgi:hypothetical protein
MPNEKPSSAGGTDNVTGDDKKIGAAESPSDGAEKEEVRQWLAAIKKAQEWRDKTDAFQNAPRFINEYKGKWEWLASAISIPLVPLNLVFAYVKTEIARLYFHNPWITISPRKTEDVSSAKIAEVVINDVWKKLKLKVQGKLALRDALLAGHGWIKVGYTMETGTVESREPEKRGRGRPRKEESVVDVNTCVKSESAFAYHVPYKNVVFDPSAVWPPMETARWVAIKWEKPLRAVKESGIYEHAEDLKPGGESDSMKEPNKDTTNVTKVTGWEIYDLDHMKVVTVSQGCDYYLRQIDYPDYLNKELPLVEFSFNPTDDVYAMSDIAAHEPQIIELSKMMCIMINHLKRWNRQIFMKPGLMTDENKTNFKNANDGAIIEIQGDPQKDFFIPPYAPVQQDIYGVWNLCMEMWKNICGQGNMDRGAEGKAATRTLGELRAQLEGGRSRSDEKLDVLEDSLEEVARKLLFIIQKKYDLPKIARVVGQKNIMEALKARPTAQPGNALQPMSVTGKQGFSWNREDIQGELDVDVLAGSTAPLDKESQIEQFEKLMPIMPALGVGPGSPPAKAFGREFMRMIGIPSLEMIMDMIDQMPPQPPPKMAEIQAKLQAKQQEVKAKVQGKQAELQMKGQEHQLKMQSLQAKTQADIVKAKVDVQKAQHGMQMDVLKHMLSGVRGNGNGTENDSGAV